MVFISNSTYRGWTKSVLGVEVEASIVLHTGKLDLDTWLQRASLIPLNIIAVIEMT